MSSEEERPVVEVGDDGTISDLLGLPIPPAVKKNFVKAFNRLTTNAVDLPAAWLEGKAAEMRAASAARISLINASASSIAGNIPVSDKYAKAALEKFAQQIVGDRIIVDEIALRSQEILSESHRENRPQAENIGEISDHFLKNFEENAKLSSTDEMKERFSRILAGEIQQPGSFSTRTLRVMSAIDQDLAQIFVRLCSCAFALHSSSDQILDVRVPGLGNANSNSLLNYGFSFSTLNMLHDNELIIPDYNSYHTYYLSPKNGRQYQSIALHRNKAVFVLQPRDKIAPPNKDLRVHGVALSSIGKQLYSLVDLIDVPDYDLALAEHYGKLGFDFVRFKNYGSV